MVLLTLFRQCESPRGPNIADLKEALAQRGLHWVYDESCITLTSTPLTPPSVFSQTPSTPQSSGSSVSQTFGGTPCPANNAFAPLPDFSDEMEGVVFTLRAFTWTE
ncbi:hypothetical protein F5883DRAFT_643677 [Diaporthe sp. PMI_573]|nr:hypothetical protein F5883DRAFT_643677 [Diaporthaceae sp. PMI_573]